jgi:hypothetical protein
MEFLLPVALKLFPNMLPSTFEDKFAAVRLQQSTLYHLTDAMSRKRRNGNCSE